MADSANWRIPSERKAEAGAGTGTDGNRSWRSSWRGRDNNSGPRREPDLRRAERKCEDDVRVHRPNPQKDDDAASQAIAEGRRIYLGNLLYQTQPEAIETFLETNGVSPAAGIHTSLDPFTGRNPGYCFIEFSSKEAADGAMEVLEGKELSGRPVKCRPCQPKGNVRRTTWGSSSFDRWGNWTDSRRRDADEGERDRPVTDLQGRSGPEQARQYLERSHAIGEGRQLYVGGLPRMMDQAMNEEEIRSIFQGFEVVAISKRVSPGDAVKRREGRHNFCFVDFSTAEQAKNALAAANGTSYRDGKLKVSMARGRGGIL